MGSTCVHRTYQIQLLKLANDVFVEVNDRVSCVRPPRLSALLPILIYQYHCVVYVFNVLSDQNYSAYRGKRFT